MHENIRTRRRFLQIGVSLGAASILQSWLTPKPVEAQNPPPPEPVNPDWTTTIVPTGEPGDPLVVSGRVFAPDGLHTVADVIVHAYNTDKEGYYSSDGKVGFNAIGCQCALWKPKTISCSLLSMMRDKSWTRLNAADSSI